MSSSVPFVTDSVVQAAHWLNQGQLLAYPTESVWGIGCNPFDKSAVQQLLTIKQRPQDKGMIVVTDSIERITPLLAPLSPEQRQTVLASWQPSDDVIVQQAHTWLLPIPDSLTTPIPEWITGAHDSIAVRVITHPLVQNLCAQLVSANNPYGFLVSTSCNPSGQMPALTLAEAQSYFLSKSSQLLKQVGYLRGATLGYQLPSQIGDARSGQIIR